MITELAFNGYTIPHGRIIKIDGLDTPPYRVSSSSYAGTSGGRFNAAYADTRSVTIEFLVLEDDMDGYLSERSGIFDAFNAEDGENNLTIEVNDETTYRLACVPVGVKMPARAAMATYTPCQVQLLAFDPTIYADTASSEANIGVPTGGGATFPLLFPITFESSGATGMVTISNSGDVDSYPTLTLSGLLTNPLIRNTTTGDTFQLTNTSLVSDSIVIDMKNRTVVKNGNTNLLSSVVAGSDWWSLQPGSNTIAFSTSSTSDTGTLTISWRNSWSGV